MASFAGRRGRRPRLMAAAVVSALATGGACAALMIALQARAGAVVALLGLAGFVVFVGLLRAAIAPAPAAIEVAGGEVRASWRASPLVVRRVEVGRWVMDLGDTPVGVLLEVVGADGERLRIGGEGHDGRGYVCVSRAPGQSPGLARRFVDIAVSRDDLDAIAAVLGVARVPGEIAVDLVRSWQTAGGMLHTIGPWLATITAVVVLGITAAVTGSAERIARSPHGIIFVGGVAILLLLAGIAWTVVRTVRVRPPELTLQAAGDYLALIDRSGTKSVPWSAVRASPRVHVVRTKGLRWTIPALELALGDRTVAFAAWGASPDWGGDVPRLRRTPRWLAGPPQFASLVAELRRRNCFAPA